MFKVLMVAAALGLVGSTAAVAQSPASPTAAAAAPVAAWQEGVRAGTTKFSAIPGATCKPQLGTNASDKRCKMTFSGKFTATDRGYKGTYTGSATINYINAGEAYAAFDSGTVTYTIRNLQGQLLDTVTLGIDLGTGGVYGYPFDLSISYWIEERIEGPTHNIVLRMEGDAVNQLDANLKPIRTFIDRLAYN